MYRKISQSFIHDLLEYIDIVYFLSERINLKKKGKHFYSFCPFHSEQVPSFVVNRERQFYYCFGCGAHGNVIDFLMQYDQLKFIEAIEVLSIHNGWKILYEKYDEENQKLFIRRKIYQLMEKLMIFYQKSLELRESKVAYLYLFNRGFSKETIKRFSIGFSPRDQKYLTNFLNRSIEDLNILDCIGSIFRNEKNKIIDLFRGRIIFPIRNCFGQVIAFGGRVLGEDKPKYLNSSETELFKKSQQLYGLYEIHKKYEKVSELLIVEGYTDVLSLSEYGIGYSVASLGTSVTANQIQKIYRKTDLAIFCYDGDNAGKEAYWKNLKTIIPFLTDNRQLKFMILPSGEDPDSYIRKNGKKSFEKLISNAKSFSSFFFEKLTESFAVNDLDSSVKISALAIPLINQIPGKMFRFFLLKKLGKILRIPDWKQLNLFFPKVKIQEKENISFIKIENSRNIKILIGLLLQKPELSSLVTNLQEITKISLPGLSIFLELVRFCKEKKKITTAQLLERFRDRKYYIILKRLSILDYMVSEETVEQTFNEVLLNIYNLHIMERQEELIKQEKIRGLTDIEKKEFWFLSKILLKNRKIR